MAERVHTHLLFLKGQAEQALDAYADIFGDSFSIDSIEHFAADSDGPEGKVQSAQFSLLGQTFSCQDSPTSHEFDMTPAVSLYLTCSDQNEIDELFATLSTEGQVFMPLHNYGFSARFGWLSDRYDVSWQLNLE